MNRSFKPLLNQGLLFVLALLVVLPPAAAAQDETPQPPASAERPLIFIRSSWVEPAVVAPGQLCRLYLELHNVGDASASNIVVSIAGTNFVPELSSSVKTVGSLPARRACDGVAGDARRAEHRERRLPSDGCDQLRG